MSAALKGWCSLGQGPAWFSRSSLRCLFCIWRLSFVLVFHSGVIFHWERANRQSRDRWSGLLQESRCVNEGWSPLPLHTNGSNISINASEACPSPFSEGDKTDRSPFWNSGACAISWGIVQEFRKYLGCQLFPRGSPHAVATWEDTQERHWAVQVKQGTGLMCLNIMFNSWVLQVAVSPEHSDWAG